jgi:uncharacterized protein (TIGR04255 family)
VEGSAQEVEQPRYARNPIVEAVLELQVAGSDSVTVADLRNVHVGEEQRYPNVQNRMLVENRIEVTGGAISTRLDQNQIGYVYSSADDVQTFHATTSSFLFSRLKPYTDWNAFLSEADRLWKHYRAVADPVAVTRFGVRFINRIQVPAKQIEVQDYIRTYPELSPKLPQSLAGYFMQVTVPLADYDALANISSTISKQSDESVTIVLDVDCYREAFFAIESEAFDLLSSETLERLHRAKNFVFEACITDATRGLID